MMSRREESKFGRFRLATSLQCCRRVPLLLFLVLSLSTLVHPSAGLETLHEILHNNRRWTLLDRFAFYGGGFVEVHVSNIVVYSPEKSTPPDTYSIGVLLASQADATWIERQSSLLSIPGAAPQVCPLSSPNITRIFTIMDLGPPAHGGKHKQKDITVPVPSEGSYGLYLINCAPSCLVSADLSVLMYNVGAGGEKLFLPAGSIVLAFVDITVAALYVVALGVWLCHVSKVWCKTMSPPLFQVLLTASLPLLAVTFAVSGAALLRRQSLGSSFSLDWVLDILILVSGLTLISSFVTGLEQIDPYLTHVERGVLYITIPIWLLCQMALAMSQSTGFLPWVMSPDSSTWITLLDILDVVVPVALALLALLLLSEFGAMVCSQLMRRRRDRTRDDREDEGPLSKFYVQMSIVFVLTSLLTRLLPTVLPFNLAWVPDAIGHVALLAFLSFTLYRVRPSLEKSLYQLFDENDDLDEELEEL